MWHKKMYTYFSDKKYAVYNLARDDIWHVQKCVPLG